MFVLESSDAVKQLSEKDRMKVLKEVG